MCSRFCPIFEREFHTGSLVIALARNALKLFEAMVVAGMVQKAMKTQLNSPVPSMNNKKYPHAARLTKFIT